MRRTPAPLLLLAVVTVGWTGARSTYLGWQAVVESSPQSVPTPIMLVPLDGPFMIRPEAGDLSSQVRGGARDSVALRPVRPAMRTVHSSATSLTMAHGAGGSSQFIAVQQALLARMTRPRSADAMAMMRNPAFANMVRDDGLSGSGGGWTNRSVAAPGAGARQGRWSVSSWLFARNGVGVRSLAEQSLLGGTQAGPRLTYRLDRDGRLYAFARVSASPMAAGSIEGATGVALRPLRSVPVPVELVLERRLRLIGANARSAFAIFATAGVSDMVLAQGFLLDAYGAAGIVGMRRRDLFAKGSARAVREVAAIGPLRVSIGGGAWGAAQPDAARLDVGPTLVTRLDPSRIAAPRLSIDYRNRVAGNSVPGSGMAVTLAADF